MFPCTSSLHKHIRFRSVKRGLTSAQTWKRKQTSLNFLTRKTQTLSMNEVIEPGMP